MQIHSAVALKNKTTIRLGGVAYQELVFESYKDEDRILRHIEQEGLPVRTIGGGSNLLVTDSPLDILLLRSAHIEDVCVVGETEEHISFTAPLAMPLQKFIAKAISFGAQGFEGLAGIPGTLGGAIAMNAGSFGSETTKYLTRLHILSTTEGIQTYTAEQWHSSYRTFTLLEHNAPFLAFQAEFTTPKLASTILKQRFADAMAMKKSRQPLQGFSAGCIFKNPAEGESAGKLLEAVGMKSITSKHFLFSEEHANFLIHTGGGTTQEACALIDEAIARVEQSFSCTLEKEVKMWL